MQLRIAQVGGIIMGLFVAAAVVAGMISAMVMLGLRSGPAPAFKPLQRASI